MSTPAQDEFNRLIHNQRTPSNAHPEDAGSSSDNDGTTLTPSHSGEPHNLSPPRTGRMPSITYTLPKTTNFQANTGPKGVIADARSFETAKKRSLRQTLHAFANGATFGKNKESACDYSREKSPSPDLSADDDGDFMREWRATRLDELARMKSQVTTKRRSPSKRKYGGLVAVDAVGYLDAVEKVSAGTIVVVLIYDHEVRTQRLGVRGRFARLTLDVVERKRQSGRCARPDCTQACHNTFREAASTGSRDGRDSRAGHPGLPGRRVLRQLGVYHERHVGGQGDERGESRRGAARVRPPPCDSTEDQTTDRLRQAQDTDLVPRDIICTSLHAAVLVGVVTLQHGISVLPTAALGVIWDMMGIKARISFVNLEDTHWPGRDHDILIGRDGVYFGFSFEDCITDDGRHISKKIDMLTHNNSNQRRSSQVSMLSNPCLQ